MAFVSKTPGRTQHINFFSVGPDRYFVDLPGYGYAAVPAAARAHWNDLVGGYLQSRSTLRAVVLIMDVRHPLTTLDRQLIEWFAPTTKPLHALLSKADKLSRQHGLAALREVERAFAREHLNYTAQLFSSTHKTGIVEAVDTINGWFDAPPHKKAPG
jgi:GTP-binding protein